MLEQWDFVLLLWTERAFGWGLPSWGLCCTLWFSQNTLTLSSTWKVPAPEWLRGGHLTGKVHSPAEPETQWAAARCQNQDQWMNLWTCGSEASPKASCYLQHFCKIFMECYQQKLTPSTCGFRSFNSSQDLRYLIIYKEQRSILIGQDVLGGKVWYELHFWRHSPTKLQLLQNYSYKDKIAVIRTFRFSLRL